MPAERTFITEGDFNEMYRNADSEERLMLTMGVAEAMRRGEIGDLRFSNIKGNSLEFWSKRFGPDGKLSVLPMMDNVRDALERYMQKRGMIVEKWGEYDPDAILLNSYGMPMSGDVVYSRLKDLAKRLGVDEFTPHSLRRSQQQR
jgi:integrase